MDDLINAIPATIAITILTLWALGIVLAIATFPSFLRDNPMGRLAFDINPVAAYLATAIAIVFWPGALGAAALNKIADRRKP